MLKNVVLPAPFGPMRLTMLPRGIVKSMSLTATRPPKRFVQSVATSRSPEVIVASAGAAGRPSSGVLREVVLADGLGWRVRLERGPGHGGRITALLGSSGRASKTSSSATASSASPPPVSSEAMPTPCISALAASAGNRPSGRLTIITARMTPKIRKL